MIFLKLGGSLITEKSQTETARLEVIDRLATEIQGARRENPELTILLGHGSGSFGHHAAAKFGAHFGASTIEDWKGVAAVWKAANKLHRFVMDSLLAAGLPVISFPPSASALAQDGELISLAIQPIQLALSKGLIPVTHGDVVFDETRGATIASTEAIFSYLTEPIKPSRILLSGLTPGVYDHSGEILPSISHLFRRGFRPFTRCTPRFTEGDADHVTTVFIIIRAISLLDSGGKTHLLQGRT